MEEQNNANSCFHMFMRVYMVKTTQGATKMFAVDVNKRQIS